jgi:hypothetical protein
MTPPWTSSAVQWQVHCVVACVDNPNQSTVRGIVLGRGPDIGDLGSLTDFSLHDPYQCCVNYLSRTSGLTIMHLLRVQY